MSAPDEHAVAAFAGHPTVGTEELVAFWVAEGALDEATARVRVHDVLFVATAADGSVAAVGSAFLAVQPQLRMDLWHYRTYVGRAHRRSALALTMAGMSAELLEERWTSGADRRGAGLVFDLQSAILRTHFRDAVWPRTLMAFVTSRPEADVRVRYFPGALAPDPPR